jgi:hypothetical protein
MSLAIDGFWKSGFWTQTFWADGFWYEGDPVIPPATPTVRPTGGSIPRVRYRTDKEVRDERIARGIIPPDEPEIQTIVEASKAPSPTLAKRRLRELVEGHIRLAELDRMLSEVIQAQQIADEFAYQDMQRELQREQRQLTNLNNRNAVLIMLGLL